MINPQGKNTKDKKAQLRNFGITLSIVLAIWGGLFLWRERGYYTYFFIASVLFLSLGLIAPILLRPLKRILAALTGFVSWLVTSLILLAIFYFVVTPLGILAKVFGKRFLDIKFNNGVNSYWIPRQPAKIDKQRYKHQF